MEKTKPIGGRKKGQTNLATRERLTIAEKALQQGVTPLDVMLRAMREAYGRKDLKEAARYADMAAPYVHPRLQTIGLNVDGEVRNYVISGEPITVDEWEAEYSLGPPIGTGES